mmetsp:Transcript_16199/g.19445  ORF Transcript_16199/g.19445 Transcript_16199/m.19445 type:complete len:406 (+) Transcript_16199:494-1711(+)
MRTLDGLRSLCMRVGVISCRHCIAVATWTASCSLFSMGGGVPPLLCSQSCAFPFGMYCVMRKHPSGGSRDAPRNGTTCGERICDISLTCRKNLWICFWVCPLINTFFTATSAPCSRPRNTSPRVPLPMRSNGALKSREDRSISFGWINQLLAMALRRSSGRGDQISTGDSHAGSLSVWAVVFTGASMLEIPEGVAGGVLGLTGSFLTGASTFTLFFSGVCNSTTTVFFLDSFDPFASAAEVLEGVVDTELGDSEGVVAAEVADSGDNPVFAAIVLTMQVGWFSSTAPSKDGFLVGSASLRFCTFGERAALIGTPYSFLGPLALFAAGDAVGVVVGVAFGVVFGEASFALELSWLLDEDPPKVLLRTERRCRLQVLRSSCSCCPSFASSPSRASFSLFRTSTSVLA